MKTLPISQLVEKNLQNGLYRKGMKFGSGTAIVRMVDLYRMDTIEASKLDRVISNETEIKKYGLVEGDLLLNRTSLKKEGIGKCSIAGRNSEPILFDCSIIRLRINRKVALPKYLMYFLNSSLGKSQIRAFSKTATITTIAQPQIRDIRVPIPNLENQRNIVAILERADMLRQKRERANMMANKILQAAFLNMFGDPAINQMGWKVTAFENLITEMRYGTSVKCSAEDTEGTPILRIPNIINGKVELTDLKYATLSQKEIDKIKLVEGDMLFVRTNGNREYVGRSAVFHEKDRVIAFASYLIRARLSENINADFANVFLTLPYVRKQILRNARTSAGQYNINTKGLKAIKFIVPPFELQQHFVAFLQKVEVLKKNQTQSTKKIKQLFVSLLNKAFKGELIAEVHPEKLLEEEKQPSLVDFMSK